MSSSPVHLRLTCSSAFIWWPMSSVDCYRWQLNRYIVLSQIKRRRIETTPTPTVVSLSVTEIVTLMIAMDLWNAITRKIHSLISKKCYATPSMNIHLEMTVEFVSHFIHVPFDSFCYSFLCNYIASHSAPRLFSTILPSSLNDLPVRRCLDRHSVSP